MMRPPCGCCLRITRNASRVQRKAPVRLTFTTACHSSSEISSRSRGGAPMPALLKSKSTRPCRVTWCRRGSVPTPPRSHRLERDQAAAADARPPARPARRPAARKHDEPTVCRERSCNRGSDSTPCSGNHRDLVAHGRPSFRLVSVSDMKKHGLVRPEPNKQPIPPTADSPTPGRGTATRSTPPRLSWPAGRRRSSSRSSTTAAGCWWPP